jgi:hypothetical protein
VACWEYAAGGRGGQHYDAICVKLGGCVMSGIVQLISGRLHQKQAVRRGFGMAPHLLL